MPKNLFLFLDYHKHKFDIPYKLIHYKQYFLNYVINHIDYLNNYHQLNYTETFYNPLKNISLILYKSNGYFFNYSPK